jgi:hypothetical protein
MGSLRTRAALAPLLLGLIGCGGERTQRAAGEVCVASTECADGLVCDFGQEPARCAETGSGGGPDPIDAATFDGAPGTIDADLGPADAGAPDAEPPDAAPV